MLIVSVHAERNRGQRKPIEKRTLPLLVDNIFFYLKDGSQTEKGFTAVCCQCHKDTSVSWGVSSPLVRHLKIKGHEDLFTRYEASKQLANVLPTELYN